MPRLSSSSQSSRSAAAVVGLRACAALVILAMMAATCVPAPVSAGNALCPEGHFCYSDALQSNASFACLPSQYCPGDRSGALCAKGFYCPNPRVQIECPSGHYCPPASISPRPCSPLAYCPAGSWRYFHWGTLLLLLILLPLIAAGGWIYDAVNSRLNASTAAASKSAALSPNANASALTNVPRMSVQFKNLSASVEVSGKDKVILADVSGSFQPGRLIAVMGPSGAGKSSLIGALTGTLKISGGSIETRIEGGVEKDLRQARRLGMIGVVPQADIMIPQLTPRDILTHSAFTRLPATWTSTQKTARVDETLAVLNLTKVQHTPVGDENVRGVSGGECKRCSIGIELVNSPSLLILDEPTTGLDASSSSALVSTLKRITALQTTVVAVLHQPRNEIFRAMDDLLLLAPGGRTVYFGPAALAQSYFELIGYAVDANTNPTDHFIDVIAAKAGTPKIEGDFKREVVDNAASIQAYLVEQWSTEAGAKFSQQHGLDAAAATSAKEAAAPAFKSTVELPSAFTLFYLFAYRGVLQLVRNLATVRLELFLHLVAGGLIGMAFVEENWFLPPINPAYVAYCPAPMQRSCTQDAVKDSINLMLTYTVMALGLVAAIIGNRNFGQELTNMVRESSTGISSGAYFWGKCVAELPLIALYSFLYTCAYYMVCSPASPFGNFYAAIFLFELVLFSVGYVASLLLTGENALLLSAIGALLAGLGTENSFEKNLVWSRWFGEMLFISEARIDLLQSPSDQIVQAYMDGRNHYHISNYNTDVLALIIFAVVLRLWASWLVWRKFRSSNSK